MPKGFTQKWAAGVSNGHFIVIARLGMAWRVQLQHLRLSLGGVQPCFPLLAIGAIIGAVSSIAKGITWISHKLSGIEDAGEDDVKTGAKGASTKATKFSDVLAAQTAGQTVPIGPSCATPTASVTMSTPTTSRMTPSGTIGLTEADVHARIQSGLAAYSRLGERREQSPLEELTA